MAAINKNLAFPDNYQNSLTVPGPMNKINTMLFCVSAVLFSFFMAHPKAVNSQCVTVCTWIKPWLYSEQVKPNMPSVSNISCPYGAKHTLHVLGIQSSKVKPPFNRHVMYTVCETVPAGSEVSTDHLQSNESVIHSYFMFCLEYFDTSLRLYNTEVIFCCIK